MTIEAIQLIHEAMADGDMIEAANLTMQADGSDVTVTTKEEAFLTLKSLEKNLGEAGKYSEVAVLLWGNEMFDSRPQCVRDVFRKVRENSKLIIFGASSTSKTFSCGVLFYLFWRMDSYWTAVKLAAPSETHLYGNLFSHLVALHKASVLPMTLDDIKNVDINETEMFISMHDALPEMRIQGVLCKQNQVSAGALRGHKPKPYRKPSHPKYGNSTRLYILIDECTQVSPGAFEDIKTTEASIDPELDNVKIVMACNPEGITYRIVQMAEPDEGWDPEQVDTLYEWTSREGYPVLRLDGKLFENVVARKTIYPRMLTYEAFLGFLKGGEHSANYWAKGRGFPPLKDNAWTIIPPAWMQSQRGEPIYVSNVTNIAAVDTALSGSDKALLGIGRFGEAAGWQSFTGETVWFKDRTNPSERRSQHVAVLDQIFELPKTSSTVEVIQEVMGRCVKMGIPPENVAMDSTGNAAGVWSHAKAYWGNVLGVEFGVKASDMRVLSEDLQTCYETYDGKVTELWFAMKRWLDPVVCAFLINTMVPTRPLASEMTGRRYRNVKGGRVRVEPKHEFRVRNHGESPDHADIASLIVEWCRQRGGVIPGMKEIRENESQPGAEKVSPKNADEESTLYGDQQWEANHLQMPDA